MVRTPAFQAPVGLPRSRPVVSSRARAPAWRLGASPTPGGRGARSVIRVAVPSKGDMHSGTRDLLREIGLDLVMANPRQYEACLRGLDLQLWLQRPVDIVRKIRDADVDLGFVGRDLVAEYGGDGGLVVPVHEDLGYGRCRLSVGVPMDWVDVADVAGLRKHSKKKTLRVATKFKNETVRFMRSQGIENYRLVPMEGALEASTQMGTADCIVDLVSSGTTLRENMLKEIDDGIVLESSMQLVGNRKHLREQSPFGDSLRTLAKEILERIDAHLIGRDTYNVIANIRGSSMVDVSRKLSSQTDLQGVDGPTVSPVVPPADSDEGMYAISIVLPKGRLYSAVKQLRKVGGSGVTVLPVKYVFPEECRRWNALLESLDIDEKAAGNGVEVKEKVAGKHVL